MSAPHQVLEQGRILAAMSFGELWLAYFALGGCSTPRRIRSYLDGGSGASTIDYDLLAQAINERFVDHGDGHPLPYHDEL